MVVAVVAADKLDDVATAADGDGDFSVDVDVEHDEDYAVFAVVAYEGEVVVPIVVVHGVVVVVAADLWE